MTKYCKKSYILTNKFIFKLVSFVSKKLYWALHNQVYMIVLFGVSTIVFGLIGYLNLNKDFMDALSSSLGHFAMESSDEKNIFLSLSLICASFTVGFLITLTLLKDFVDKWRVSLLRNNQHYLLIGLGQNNCYFLDSIIKKTIEEKPTIVIEKMSNHPQIDFYREKGIGIQIVDIIHDENFLKKSLCNSTHVIISSGDDRTNIDISKKIYDNTYNNLQVLVHITNRELNQLYSSNLLTNKKTDNKLVEIRTFSFYSIAVKELFLKYKLLPNNFEGDAEIAIVGKSQLSLEIVYFAIQAFQNPEQYSLTIHLVDKEAQSLLSILHYQFPSLENIPRVKFKTYQFDRKIKQFYEQEFWKSQNLVGIYLCFENDNDNLHTAVDLYDFIFRREIENLVYLRVFAAIFDKMSLSEIIDYDEENFKNFYTFANSSNISSKENLIDSSNDKIAKMIHYGYAEEFDKSMAFYEKECNEKWIYKASFSDRESSFSQALHIDVKLQALGLKREKSSKNFKTLLKINRDILDKSLQIDEEYYEKLVEFSKDNSKWNMFDFNCIKQIEKLARAEHDRWNSFHWLNGWIYGEKNKDKKIHDCLIPLEEFDDSKKNLVLYDLYSILYIPNFLAGSGWKIIKD